MKKKTIKINFKYFWEGFNKEKNFFTNLLRKKYDVIISENPDYLFYSVYQEIKISKDLSKKGDFIRKLSPKLHLLLRKIYSRIIDFSIKDKFPLPKGNFTKIFFGSELIKPNMDECDWAFSEYPEEEINNLRHMKLIILVNDYQLKYSGIPPIKKKINFSKIKKEKTKFCNFIYARDIIKRNDFFKELSKYKKIDAPGRCMNNMLPIGTHEDPKKSRLAINGVKEKLNFLKQYKFTIAFENSFKPGYISEKLTHPMLVNSIPIYFGHKDVKKDFNTKSFINYSDFKDMDEFIKYIRKADNDNKLYERILKEPWYKDNELPRDLNIKRIENRLKEIVESKNEK